jgi:hypothetical protein
MYGSRDPRSRLWRVDLKHRFETNQEQCNHAHDNSYQKDLINYLHAACFSPKNQHGSQQSKMEISHHGRV